MKELQTVHGETFLVDDEDYEKAKQYRWTLRTDSGRGDIVTKIEGFRRISYKRLILGLESKLTLYKNNNPLDVRKENLMVFDNRREFAKAMTTMYESNISAEYKQGKLRNSKFGKTSQYVGVIFDKSRGKWAAHIQYHKKSYHLGRFLTEEEAATAYDKKALELYGENAKLNLPHLNPVVPKDVAKKERMEMIQVLLETVEEQQTLIETLRKEVETLRTANNLLQSEDASTGLTNSLTAGTAIQDMCLSDAANAETMKLYQNTPNPFYGRTTIKCYVPRNIKKVQLCVYNMQGVQMLDIITERGNVTIQIETGALPADVYNYVLLGDGAASETKQMVLTKLKMCL